MRPKLVAAYVVGINTTHMADPVVAPGYIRWLMDPGIVNSVFQALRQDAHTFLFSARFHDEHTARLIALGESIFTTGPGQSKGRIAFLMVEAFQNVIRHRAPMPPALEAAQGRSMFMLRWLPSGPEVITANPVAKEHVPVLEENIARLKGADAAALKRMFLNTLSQEHDGNRRGAGLGLIEMARRSGSDPGHSVRGLGPDRSLFVLTIRVGNARQHDASLADAAVFHGVTVQNDLMLLYCGTTVPSIDSALLQMLENDVVADQERGRALGRAFMAASAWLRSDPDRLGKSIVWVSRNGAHFIIALGQRMAPAAADRLMAQVAEVNALDRSELDRRYRRSLTQQGTGQGADLFDLARVSLEPLLCNSYPVGDERLLVVQATV